MIDGTGELLFLARVSGFSLRSLQTIRGRDGHYRNSSSWWLVLLIISGASCRLEMHDQPKHQALESSAFFEDGSSARSLAIGTIPRGHLHTNQIYFEGLSGTNLTDELPVNLSREVLDRGQERFDIYCSVCHGLTGDGNGMIVQRGFPRPPSFHIDRLREAPLGHFYRVITYGYGVMFPYAIRVTPEDRWAIVAYIRALQLSQSAKLANVSATARAQLEGAP
jgi:mono/diheme cytochrome c family protein